MSLATYARKRNFGKTREPRPAVPRRTGRLFVIQKHDASHLHYDFRLEFGGVLWSWAVPKGPSLNPATKRLAIQVEDHPVDYGHFEGAIPQGEYGGGTVLLWDTGQWTPLDEDPRRAHRQGKLSFSLEGEKLRGAWALTRLRERDGSKPQWLLIKKRDEFARDDGDDVLEKQPLSVKTQRTLEQIAGRGGKPVKAQKPAKSTSTATTRKPARAKAPAKLPASLNPATLRPQLCTLAETAPAGNEWLHEMKFDGYRLLAHRAGSEVKLITRTGLDWTGRFSPVADAIGAIGTANHSFILDGEVCIVDPDGRTSFQKLQNAIKARDFKHMVFFAFDLLALNGVDVRALPLLERKTMLATLLGRTKARAVVRYSDHVIGDGAKVQVDACRHGLEGIVSKLSTAAYQSRRSRTWLKVKCSRRQEFVIVGFTPPEGSRRHFGSLLLAAHNAHGELVYTGKVGTGFDEAGLRDLAARMKPLHRDSSPLHGAPPKDGLRRVTWINATLVAEVAFTEWTDDGRLRHPSFQGLREDKPAKKVRIEMRAEPIQTAHHAHVEVKELPVKSSSEEVGGVTITNASRVLFDDSSVTKGDLARYYELVAPRILPYISDRPISTVRCPAGPADARGCFFQRHPNAAIGDAVKTIQVKGKVGNGEYIWLNSVTSLITLVQFGTIEFHPWGAPNKRLEAPDRLTFDLDPGPNVQFAKIKKAAIDIRDMLQAVDLQSFLLVSGGKGLHVVAPLTWRSAQSSTHRWQLAKSFAHAVALRLSNDHSHSYVSNARKEIRSGKIFIDYLRNSRGATSVAPYSARARPGATVAMPIRWEELADLKSPTQFTIDGIKEHFKHHRADPWSKFFAVRQSLPAQ